jgi:hypothetical protein
LLESVAPEEGEDQKKSDSFHQLPPPPTQPEAGSVQLDWHVVVDAPHASVQSFVHALMTHLGPSQATLHPPLGQSIVELPVPET